MRILYGVVGEGMGHATRSAVVLEHLLGSGHEVRVVVSGRAHAFLVERLRAYPNARLEEIHGLTLRYFGNRLDRAGSLFWNLRNAPKGVRKNIKVYRKVAEEGFRPQMVMSDFESFAALYALKHRLPVVSIDNLQILHRCKHEQKLVKGFDFRLVRAAVKIKVPRAYHYLITSFFYPPVRKKRTTLLPPILRPQVLAAQREPGEHVVVYVRAMERASLLAVLKSQSCPFHVYGKGESERVDNVEFRPLSTDGFLEDLRRARAVVAGGGFSLMSEAVHLGVPLLSIPIQHQFEQELNARYLEKLGYGAWARELDDEVLARFLDNVGRYAGALEKYERHDNSQLLACVNELVERCRRGDKAPKRLESPAMGKWSG